MIANPLIAEAENDSTQIEVSDQVATMNKIAMSTVSLVLSDDIVW